MKENVNKEELKKELLETIDILEKNSITYWLDFGTLLGAYREGKIIEHDYDIDIGILHKDLEKVKKLRTEILIESELKRDSEYLIHFSKYVDVFSYIEKENKLFCLSYTGSRGWQYPDYDFDNGFPKKWIDNMTKIKMYDREFSVPGNTAEYLIIKYGIYFDTSNMDRVKEHTTKVIGGEAVNLFEIFDIQWHNSIIRIKLLQEPIIECEIQLRENNIDGNVLYSGHFSLKDYIWIWINPNKKFENFHTFFVRINQGDKILFFQKIVCSTDLRTFNMYKFLLSNLKNGDK